MLDAQAIAKGMGPTRVPYAIRCFEEVTSTNEEVKRLVAAGAPEGSVVTSIVQTGGYGRQGRRWSSPAGSLYLSLLLRPCDHGIAACDLSTLSLALALAVHDILVPYAATADIAVKWPNDVMCAAGKLCGISLEAVGNAVCIGIGINAFEPENVVHTTGSYRAAYLERVADQAIMGPDKEQTAVLEELAAKLLVSIDRLYFQWLDKGFEALAERYNGRSFLNGRVVGISSIDGTVVDEGEVLHVDEREGSCFSATMERSERSLRGKHTSSCKRADRIEPVFALPTFRYRKSSVDPSDVGLRGSIFFHSPSIRVE